MVQRISILLLMVVLMLPCALFAQVREPVPADFARGIELEVSGDDSIYQFYLTKDVYQGLTTGNLSDLCMFNAQGEMVPFALEPPDREKEAPTQAVALPIFPIMGDAGKGVGGVSLQVKRDDKGSIINVSTSDGPAENARIVVAYLLDASALETYFTKLALDTGPMPEGEIARVSVDYSNDLKSWLRLVSGAAIADLRYGDNSLSVRDIDLGRVNVKYLRLSMQDGGPMLPVQAASVELAPKTMPRPRVWLDVNAKRNGDKPGEYIFDTTGRMPVDRLRVRLPEPNTVVKAEFLSRTGPDAPWRHRAGGVLYDMKVGGNRMVNPDLAFTPTTDRDWLIRVDSGTGGIGGGVPSVDLGWDPHRLVFAARGASPFMLAFGSGRSFPNSGGADYLLSRIEEMREKNITIKSAVPGEAVELGGPSALLSEKPPFDLKKLALWAILISGVLLLSWMATRLYRRISHPGDGGV